VRRRGALAGLALLPVAAAAQQPYTLEGTEVHELGAYTLFIALPASYKTAAARRYPVLFVTDANYAFPLVRSIGRRVGDQGRGLDEFILVGLGYARGDTPEYSRRRDYTPSAGGDRDATSDMPGRPPLFGQAEAYRRYIAEAVFPFIEKTYRADMARKVFAGHSYGALLGVHVLFTAPAMFGHYVLGSPSLWFDRRVMFAREKAYAGEHRDLPARVLLAAGAFEAVRQGDRRYNRDIDIVHDMLAFEQALKSRRYPGLRIASQVIADEDHLSVAPAILTRGLRWALPPARAGFP